jgi:hypothetical protein
MTPEELKKELWWRRGAEYKLVQKINDETALFSHELLMRTEHHTFVAPIDDVLNTSYICSKCDREDGQRAWKHIQDFLNKRNIKHKTIIHLFDTIIFWFNRKDKKIAIVYFDRRFYKNVINENERAIKLRKILGKNFDHTVILTHMEFKTLKKNLLRGLKEIW